MEQLMGYLDLGQMIQFLWENKYWIAAAVPIIIAIVVVRNLTS